MNKIGKIASIIVIVACLGSLYFTYSLGEKKKQLIADNTQLTQDLNSTRTRLAKTEATLKQTTEELTQTKTNLEQTTAALQTTKTALEQKIAEADGLKTQLADATKQLEDTKAELATNKDAMSKIQASLAQLGVGPGGVEQIAGKVTALSDENKVLGEQLASMNGENQALKKRIEELTVTPVGTRGHVSIVQDSWGFLVLDIGQAQRVAPNTEFLVYRDAKFIAKIQIVSVGYNNSIAQILSDYQRGTPRAGDLVVH